MGIIKRLLSYFPIFLLIGMAIGLLWLLWLAWNGEIQNPFVSAAASFVLVTVTIYYALQLRKSAARTAETLDEMQKNREKRGKVLTIAFGIDPILVGLRKEKGLLDPDDLDCFPLPSLEDWSEPDWAVQYDIEQSDAYPDFSNEFGKFVEDVSQYQDLREKIRERMGGRLHREFEDELKTIIDDLALSPQRGAKKYADSALRCSEQYLDPSDLNRQLNERATALRNADEFAEDVHNLESLAKCIRDWNVSIGTGLEKVRRGYKKDYGIAEHEIEEAAISSNLDDEFRFRTSEPTYLD